MGGNVGKGNKFNQEGHKVSKEEGKKKHKEGMRESRRKECKEKKMTAKRWVMGVVFP